MLLYRKLFFIKLLYDDFLKELLKVAEEREVSSNG